MSDTMRDWLHQFVKDTAFLSRYRYYAFILAKLDPIEDPYVHVMAVSLHGSRFFLHVNIDFFVRQPQYLKGVLLHEVHHLVLGHLTNPKFAQVSFPDLMELAMEISANEYIREPLPGNPPVWTNFTAFGIQQGQSTMERYELLAKARCEGRAFPVWLLVDAHLAHGVGAVHAPGEPGNLGAHSRVSRLIREAVAEANRLGTSGPGGLLAGREPGKLIEQLDASLAEPRPVMDWKTALQMFVALVRTPVHTYARPNRRFPQHIGVIPGRIYYPGQTKPPTLLVAIDTSASMTTEELSAIARQLQLLHELVRFTVVECDVVVQRVYPFQGRLDDVAGRGGTDLRPVFDAAFLRQHKADGVIYFTDGEGPYPAVDPGIKALWVLSKPHAFACPWGQKAHLPRSAGKRHHKIRT